MPEPLNGPALGEWLGKKVLQGEFTMRTGLSILANEVEAMAKFEASNGAHARGTLTPAASGQGPSVVSGDLRRAITHTRVAVVDGILQTRVGPASTPHSDSEATSGEIGRYLETGLRNGATYPFIEPALTAVAPSAFLVFRTAWDRGWDVSVTSGDEG